MLGTPPDHKWEYMESAPVYRCGNCEREVSYPETLYRDGLCETCHQLGKGADL